MTLNLFLNIRILHRSTSDCHQGRPHHMHHIHRHHTPHQTTQFWFNNIIRCHHHKDQSRSYLTVRHHNCHPHPNRTPQCSIRPPRPSIKPTKCMCRQADDERVARIRSVERSMGWTIATHGALNASGRRRAAVSVTENY